MNFAAEDEEATRRTFREAATEAGIHVAAKGCVPDCFTDPECNEATGWRLPAPLDDTLAATLAAA